MPTEKESWKQGWRNNSTTVRQSPLWSLSSSGGFHKSTKEVTTSPSKNVVFKSGGGFRKTWVQEISVNPRQVNPGPGSYRTDSDTPTKTGDYLDVNKTVRERPPLFSVGKSFNETILSRVKLSTLKPSNLNVPATVKSNIMMPTPGPGQYSQYTYFGGSSGGSRKTYFYTRFAFI